MQTVSTALVAILLFGATACGAPSVAEWTPATLTTGAELAALSWLSGTWTEGSNGEVTEEHWSEPRGGTLIGMNRTVREGRTVHFESLRIEQRPGGIFYVASPIGQPTAEFRLAASAKHQTAVFENLERSEFPQRIIYRREGEVLHARVEGPGTQSAEWTWSRPGDKPAPSPDVGSAAPHVALVDDELVFDAQWPKGDAAALGLDRDALDAVIREAVKTDSDALLVMKGGQTVVERYFGKPMGPIETMSMTKSIVSIVIGMLIAEGKIASLDAPLSTWFDDWQTGLKAKVTLRHVLTHTSGLEHRQGARVLNEQNDRLAFVRKSPIVEEPGSRFSYSNEAVQLLSGVVLAAAGRPLDEYAADALFAPLGITTFSWDKDEAGNVQAFYGLALSARDLARIARLMLKRGEWQGRQVVPAAWVDASTTGTKETPYHGLLWWIRNGRGHVSLAGEKLEGLGGPLRGVLGRHFPTHAALWLEVGSHLDEAQREKLARLVDAGREPFVEVPGPPIGFAADGWLGQQIIVLPKHEVIAIRQHRAPEDGSADDAYNKQHGFFDLVRRLERALPMAPLK